MRKYIILLVLLFVPFIAYADSPYSIRIDANKNITVNGLEEGTSYESIIHYENDILTIKEGTVISDIYTYVPLTVTSNNKEIKLRSLSTATYNDRTDPTDINIIDLYNTDDGDGSITVNGKLKIENSYYHTLNINSYVYNKSKCAVEIKNSKFDGERGLYILSNSGNIIIEDVEATASLLDAGDGSMIIKNSKIYPTSNIYAEGDGADLIIENSTIIKRGDNSQIFISDDSSNTTSKLYIKDSYIETRSIATHTSYDGTASIINSNIVSGGFDIYYSLDIIDSNIDVNSSDIQQPSGKGITLTNSKMTIHFQNTSYYFFRGFSGLLSLNNSSLIYDGMLKVNRLVLNNSYLEGTNSVENNNVVQIIESLDIHNSRFSIENKINYPAIFFEHNATVTLDNGTYFTDKNFNKLNVINTTYIDNSYTGEELDHYDLVYPTDNSKIVTSVMVSSSATITFKVVNGTWADGTTDDIVITKEVWTKLQNGEIPSVLSNTIGGSWDTIPNLDEYITSDKVYTYTYGEVKGVEENPKTGIFNDILLFIPVIIFMLGFNYLKKFELFKKM